MADSSGRPAAPFDSSARRAEFERAHAGLLAALGSEEPAALAERFIALEARLDAGMIEVKTALLSSGLLTTEEDLALGAWIHRQHDGLARSGRCIVEVAMGDAVDADRATRVLALTMLHWGEAVKWELMVGRRQQRDHAMIHGLMRMAIAKGRRRDRGVLVVDGLQRQATIEALYFRTLLLDRFTSGTLTRQQIEVLDAWLWEWAPSLESADRPRGEKLLRADLDSDHGLRYGPRDSAGPSLYLSLEPLENRRREVIHEFHRGRMVPARGRAATMRIEAHVAVLLQLRRTFDPPQERAPRVECEPLQVEACVGMDDVVRAVATSGASLQEACARFTLLDRSDSGCLFEAPVGLGLSLCVGDLMALRLKPGAPAVLARVARRLHEPERGTALVAVQLFSDPEAPPRAVELQSSGGTAETFLFAPGADASGRHDAFVVPYRVLQSGERFTIERAGQRFTLAFNRVRRRGRGWAMAGFEILGARPVQALGLVQK